MRWRAAHAAPRGSHICCFSYRSGDEAFQYSNVCKNLPGFRGWGVLAARWQSANYIMVCLYEIGWLLRLNREGRGNGSQMQFFADTFEYSKSGYADRQPSCLDICTWNKKLTICAGTHTRIVQAQTSRHASGHFPSGASLFFVLLCGACKYTHPWGGKNLFSAGG